MTVKQSRKKLFRYVSALLAILVLSGCLAACGRNAQEQTTLDMGKYSGQVSLTAHRGFSCKAPENSIEAINLAGEMGYERVEFDIRLTKDGVWVLMHDDDIKRTTDGKGTVEEMTYKDLLAFRLDNGDKNAVPEQIPTLEQAINACNEYNMKPMIEIKTPGTGFMEKLVLEARRLFSGSELYIVSFDRNQIDALLQLQKDKPGLMYGDKLVTVWLLVSELEEDALKLAGENPELRVAFNANNKKNTDSVIKQAAERDIKLAAWTVDSLSQLDSLYQLGIRFFTTNCIYNGDAYISD